MIIQLYYSLVKREMRENLGLILENNQPVPITFQKERTWRLIIQLHTCQKNWPQYLNRLAIKAKQQIPQRQGDLWQPAGINQLGGILFRVGDIGGEVHKFLRGDRQGRAVIHDEKGVVGLIPLFPFEECIPISKWFMNWKIVHQI